MVIKPKFVRVHKFSQGLATVETDPRLGFMWGYANSHGKVVIPAQWKHTREFSEGRATVKVGQKFGFIDTKGTLVIPAIYDSVTGFKNGLARVAVHDCADEFRDEDGICREQRKDKFGYINTKGDIVWALRPWR